MRRATVREDTRIGGSEPIYNRPSNASSGVPVDRRGAPMGYTSEEIEGMRNTGLFIGQTPRGYHGSVGHLAVPSELYYLRHGGKKAHEPTIKGGKLKKNPKKGSKIRGGDLTPVRGLLYSNLQPNGYNPSLGGQHSQMGGNDYNKPYIQWIQKHPWMTTFGEVAEPYREAAQEELQELQQRLQDKLHNPKKYLDDIAKQQKVILDKQKALLPIVKKIPEWSDPTYDGVVDPRVQQMRDLIKQENDLGNDAEDIKQVDRLKDRIKNNRFFLDSDSQVEYLKGYDEVQQSFNRWTHEVWRKSLDPDQWEADSPYNLGKIWASMYNRSWQPQIDWRSTGEQIWDQFKDNFNLYKDIGTMIAEVAA
jgi:hypothetical protein